MLEVQKYLKSGKTLEDLKTEFDIGASHHPTLPIFNLNYGLDTPKLHPFSIECRSLCLDKNFDLVARAFPRFFNLHEALEINDKFVWDSFIADEKTDGSLIKYFNYRGQWIVSTRSGFGDNNVEDSGVTFSELFYKAFDPDDAKNLSEHVSYVFELVSPLNKVVREYPETRLYLLAAYQGEIEMSSLYCDKIAQLISCHRPQKYEFRSANQIYDFIRKVEISDPTFEGLVIRDFNGLRIKIKSTSYLALHRLRGEGKNRFSPKYLVPLLLANDVDELVSYFQEVKDTVDQVRDRLELHETRICDLWEKVKGIESQKDFALAIKNETPFTGMLFTARKNGIHPREVWKASPDLICKVLYA